MTGDSTTNMGEGSGAQVKEAIFSADLRDKPVAVRFLGITSSEQKQPQ